MCACVKSSRFPEDMTRDYTVIRDGKEFEVCRICGKVTDVEKGTDINLRPCYVEGIGDLCRSCAVAFG